MSEPDPFPYPGLEPREVWRHFAALNRIPRPSGAEAAAAAYVRSVTEAAGAGWAADARGNTVVSAPATPGRGSDPAVAIQAHLDMVCEKRPDVQHDFARDPIRPRVEGDRVLASGTTLGADNGIGAAMALAALTDPSVRHGPLELIFTVEEETGLHGAAALDPSLVTARRIVNLDSEDPRDLIVGCAGGAGAIVSLPVHREAPPPHWVGRDLVVSGLKGGHSGVQIHERLANAIKLCAGALSAAAQDGVRYGVSGLRGGNARNAIPRDCAASLAVAPESLTALETSVARSRSAYERQWSADEPDFALELRESAVSSDLIAQESRDRLLALLGALPHGVVTMSREFPGKVETSSNLARVDLRRAEAVIETSSRSFVAAELERVQRHIQSLTQNASGTAAVQEGYPGWQPRPDSPLLAAAREVYPHVMDEEPEVQVIHAGLECGILLSRLPGADAISFGPLIRGAHTPEEWVEIPSVLRIWNLLVAMLAAL